MFTSNAAAAVASPPSAAGQLRSARVVSFDPVLRPVAMFFGSVFEPEPSDYEGEWPAFYVSNRHPFKGPGLGFRFPAGARVEVQAIVARTAEDTVLADSTCVVVGRGVLFTVPISPWPHPPTTGLAGRSVYRHLFGIRPETEGDLPVDLTGLGEAHLEINFLDAANRVTESGR